MTAPSNVRRVRVSDSNLETEINRALSSVESVLLRQTAEIAALRLEVEKVRQAQASGLTGKV